MKIKNIEQLFRALNKMSNNQIEENEDNLFNLMLRLHAIVDDEMPTKIVNESDYQLSSDGYCYCGHSVEYYKVIFEDWADISVTLEFAVRCFYCNGNREIESIELL